MRWLFDHICIPLMQINNNVYAFFSGIAVSLSTNLFTSLCFDHNDISKQWHIYLAVIFFIVSGATSLYLSAKMTKYQLYITDKRIFDPNERKEIIYDVTGNDIRVWILAFMLLALSTVAGIGMLVANYAIYNC